MKLKQLVSSITPGNSSTVWAAVSRTPPPSQNWIHTYDPGLSCASRVRTQKKARSAGWAGADGMTGMRTLVVKRARASRSQHATNTFIFDAPRLPGKEVSVLLPACSAHMSKRECDSCLGIFSAEVQHGEWEAGEAAAQRVMPVPEPPSPYVCQSTTECPTWVIRNNVNAAFDHVVKTQNSSCASINTLHIVILSQSHIYINN